VRDILADYGLDPEQAGTVVAALQRDPERWVTFMMKFELGLEPPRPGRAWRSALTIAASYAVGGLIPLLPYMIFNSMSTSVRYSVGATLVALLIFGLVKARLTGINPVRGALQTALIGGLAAAVAFGVAKAVQ
jgi:VIT1/CCC1 family predicted Fe2+/Mn2+ transporter